MITHTPAARRKQKRQAAAQPDPESSVAASHRLIGMGRGPRPVPTELSRPAAIARLVVGGVILAGGIWSYWPTLHKLAETWLRVPDYSHGMAVVPVALFFLWIRRDSYPGLASASPWLALALLTVSIVLRHAGDAFFLTFLDGWSIVPWVAALVALIGGRPLLAWSWPAVLFLSFMVPLPFSVEHELSGPLQMVATTLSTAVLQFLGQPAFAEGNVILLGDVRLEVAQACSGLRLFVGIVALTYAYVAIIRRPWWEKVLLIFAAAPIAIGANVARIVATGLLYQVLHDESARQKIHDFAGFGMVLAAAAAFSLLLWYLRWLVKEELVMDMTAVVKRARV
jgi:exosortase